MTEEKRLRRVSRIVFGLLILGLGFIFQDIVKNEDGGPIKGTFVALFAGLLDKGGWILFWLPFIILSIFSFVMAFVDE